MEEKENLVKELIAMYALAVQNLDREAHKQLASAMKRCHGVDIARTVIDTYRTLSNEVKFQRIVKLSSGALGTPSEGDLSTGIRQRRQRRKL
jgi:hypothetical protein